MRRLFNFFFFLLLLSFEVAFTQVVFQNPKSIPSEGTPLVFTTGDFDRNGLVDIAYITEGSSNINVQYNDGVAGFTLKKTSFSSNSIGIIPMLSGNLNKDRKSDIVIFNNSVNTQQKIIIFTSQERAFASTILDAQYQVAVSKKILVADFDKDNNPNILYAPDTDPIIFYKGNGNGTYESKLLIDISGVSDFEVTDFNKDRLNDLIAIGFDDKLAIYQKSASNQFIKKIFPLSCQPRDLIVGDFNTDTYSDIIVRPLLKKSDVSLAAIS